MLFRSLKSPDLALARAVVRQAVAALPLPKEANLAVDVEPLNMI